MKIVAATLIGLFCSASASAQQAPAQPAPPPPGWGTILGRVVYDGKGKLPEPRMVILNKDVAPGQPVLIDDESLVIGKNGELAGVFVYLQSKPSKIHPSYMNAPAQQVLLDVKDFRFQPHALAIWTKDQLLVRNKLAQAVHPNFDFTNQKANMPVNPGGEAAFHLKMSEHWPMNVSCNNFGWLRALVLVRDNPYFCVTDERGIFCIPNVPTNEDLEFSFWHDRRRNMSLMRNQSPNPAHNRVLNHHGRITVKLTEPVLDLGEFLADPKKLK